MQPILLDTNVLVYLFDQNQAAKQTQAAAILPVLQELGIGRISTQSLAEFSAVVTAKLDPRLSPGETLIHVENFTRAFPILPLTSLVVMEAVRGVRDHHFAYYDAQIWATARLNQIPLVFSEDFNASRIEGVTFANPFAVDFVLEQWLSL